MTTTARAPKDEVTTPTDIDRSHPPLKIITSPWVAELSTLLSIWVNSSLLSFGPLVSPNTLVPLSSIVEYSVPFPSVNDNRLLTYHRFALLFWQTAVCPLMTGAKMYWALQQDDPDQAPPLLTELVKTDVIRIFTVSKFDEMSMATTFWCRSDMVE